MPNSMEVESLGRAGGKSEYIEGEIWEKKKKEQEIKEGGKKGSASQPAPNTNRKLDIKK